MTKQMCFEKPSLNLLRIKKSRSIYPELTTKKNKQFNQSSNQFVDTKLKTKQTEFTLKLKIQQVFSPTPVKFNYLIIKQMDNFSFKFKYLQNLNCPVHFLYSTHKDVSLMLFLKWKKKKYKFYKNTCRLYCVVTSVCVCVRVCKLSKNKLKLVVTCFN